MEIICRGMRGGKTVEAIRQAARNNYTIVCHSVNEAKRVQRIAEELGHKIPRPITFDDFKNGSTISYGTSGYVIDNADLLLQYMARGRPIRAITWTRDTDNSPYKIEATYFDEASRWDPKQYKALVEGEWGNDDEV